MTISERIFEVMRLKNIKQKDLSKHTGIPTATISAWNIRKSSPPSEKLVEIADYLGVNVQYLLGLTDNPEIMPNNPGFKITADQIHEIRNNSNNGDNVINVPAQKQDEMSEELLKRFNGLSFDRKIDVFNYIKNMEE